MRLRVIPGRTAVLALAGSSVGLLLALLMDMPVTVIGRVASGFLLALLVAAIWDYTASLHAWRLSSPTMTRQLPAAFAIGARQSVHLAIVTAGAQAWRGELYDHADPSFLTQGLPIRLSLPGASCFDATYPVTPTRRGEVTFAPADVRIRSRWGLCELLERLGTNDVRRVYPDFAQVARYAWLASDRRLQEISVKTYQLRGQGTDFKQLSEYRVGDSVRHVDWRATLRLGKPIVREFQDERDHALRLLRSRHLVLVASLRERIVGELIAQPLVSGDASIDVASAHLYEQSRRDAFNRLAAGHALMVDAEPERLGIELVNRYHAIKRAGTI